MTEKHARNDGKERMTEKSAQNEKRVLDTAGLVMLSEAKHPCAGFLTAFGMTGKVCAA